MLVGCLASQQHASVSQGRICTDKFMCCHTEMEVADPTFYLTQSQYTDTGPTSLSADPIMPCLLCHLATFCLVILLIMWTNLTNTLTATVLAGEQRTRFEYFEDIQTRMVYLKHVVRNGPYVAISVVFLPKGRVFSDSES